MKESNFVETVSDAGEVTFATDAAGMIEVDEQTYCRTAQALLDAIGEACYYNGTVTVEETAFCGTLTATLIVYRERERAEDEAVAPIYDVVPVWWEFATVLPDGDEVLNDFAFLPLKKALLELQ